MNVDDPLQQNVQRSAGLHALKQISVIVEQENRNDAATSRAVRWILRYGIVILLVLAALLARFMGVY